MKDFKVNQLTKVLVMTAIKDAEDPCSEAADHVKRVLLIALKDVNSADTDWKWIVEDACQGGMVALLLSKLDLPNGAVLILRAVAEAACELNLDATRMRDSALQGIADIQRFAGPEDMDKIKREIGRHFPMAARIFTTSLRMAMLNSLQADSAEEADINFVPD